MGVTRIFYKEPDNKGKIEVLEIRIKLADISQVNLVAKNKKNWEKRMRLEERKRMKRWKWTERGLGSLINPAHKNHKLEVLRNQQLKQCAALQITSKHDRISVLYIINTKNLCSVSRPKIPTQNRAQKKSSSINMFVSVLGGVELLLECHMELHLNGHKPFTLKARWNYNE